MLRGHGAQVWNHRETLNKRSRRNKSPVKWLLSVPKAPGKRKLSRTQCFWQHPPIPDTEARGGWLSPGKAMGDPLPADGNCTTRRAGPLRRGGWDPPRPHRSYSQSQETALTAHAQKRLRQPIIQSEVSRKEKHQCSMLTHIYGI